MYSRRGSVCALTCNGIRLKGPASCLAPHREFVSQPYKTCVDNHFCITLSPVELEALPVITIHMDDGVEVNVRPEAYMDALGRDNAYAPR